MTAAAPGAGDGGLLPARPLAAQAHALHAAAAFIEHRRHPRPVPDHRRRADRHPGAR